MSRPTLEEYRRFRVKVLEPVELPPEPTETVVRRAGVVFFCGPSIADLLNAERARIAREKWNRRL